jgi:uncharacterized DUF497 family protein
MNVRFVWDPNKAESNLRKHGVSFPVAARVFADPLRWAEVDRIVDGEERWLMIGSIEGSRILVVAYTVLGVEDAMETIRIISARRAEPRERRRYERGDDGV